MGRAERAGARERRAAHQLLASATPPRRRSMSPLEVTACFRAVDVRDPNAFSVRWLHGVALDALHLSPCQSLAPKLMTILGYAVLRRRHRIVKSLLAAGASATVSEESPNGAATDDEESVARLLSQLEGGAAAHVLECITRMRYIAARDAALGAEAPPCAICGATHCVLLFDSCACPCCEGCIWRALLRDTSARRDVRCPRCGSVCPARGRGAVNGEVTAAGGSWQCECCFRNCNASDRECRYCLAKRPPPEHVLSPSHTPHDVARTRLSANPTAARAIHTSCDDGGESGLVSAELRLTHRRFIGRQLTRLVGECLTLQAFAGGSVPCDLLGTPSTLELVVDTYAMREGACTLEADLVSTCHVPGERVRAVGRPYFHSKGDERERGGDRDDGSDWVLHVETIAVLRPLVGAEAFHGQRLPRGGDAEATGAPPPKPRVRVGALPPREAAIARLQRLTDEAARQEYCAEAAADGDVTRLDALATVGFGLSTALNEYGQSALLLASWHGHVDAVRALLCHGVDVQMVAHGGATAAHAAAAAGHAEVFKMLVQAGADPVVPSHTALSPLPSPETAQLVRLIEPTAAHPGAGACIIDGAVSEAVLVALCALHLSLPLAAEQRRSQARSERAYFCDVEGWIAASLDSAVARGVAATAMVAGRDAAAVPMPCAGEALPQMRYLCYTEAGGGLAPHTDLSRRRRRDGRVSRCTFILYLTDCAAGGETVLLKELVGGHALAEVMPRRGRLLLFPHDCPHLARDVVAEGLPKLLLRGEMV